MPGMEQTIYGSRHLFSDSIWILVKIVLLGVKSHTGPPLVGFSVNTIDTSGVMVSIRGP